MKPREAPVWTARGRPVRGILVLLALALAAGACGSSPKPPPLVLEDALRDPRAGQRTRAVAEIGRRGDRTYVPDLIELLDDPDPGVRMAASATLRELTGHDTGYEPWADPPARRRQLEAWRQWYDQSRRTPAAGT